MYIPKVIYKAGHIVGITFKVFNVLSVRVLVRQEYILETLKEEKLLLQLY